MRGGRSVRCTWFGLLVAVGVVVGLGAGYGVSTRQPTLYRAETSLVVQRGNQPLEGGTGPHGLVTTFRHLLESNLVATNVIQLVALPESPSRFLSRLSVAENDGSAVLRVRFDDPSRAKAVQTVQEIGLFFPQTVRERFGQVTTALPDPVNVSVFDQAHPLPGKASPRVSRDLAWGALFGLLGGLLVANLATTQRRRPADARILPVLGDVNSPGGFDQAANSLVALSAKQPFQTIALEGDPDGAVTAGLAHALAARGELTIWIQAADADAAELDRLSARCSYVLVAGQNDLGAALESAVDAVITVTDEVNGAAASPARPGRKRALGILIAHGSAAV